MFRKSLAFILLGAAFCAVSYAQTPDAKESKAFSMLFDSGGSYLGIETEEVTKENFGKFGLREVRGVAIKKVIEGSPAQAAGLQNGDVIVRFDGEEITSVRKLTRLIGEVAADHQVKLTVLRNGGDRDITATLGKRPAAGFEGGGFAMSGVPGQIRRMDFPPMAEMPGLQAIPSTPGMSGGNFIWRGGNSRRIGVNTTPLTKQLSEHFGVAGGILINNVREDSPAAKAGLRAGDIIVELDGKQVKSDFDLIRGIGEKKEGDVSLTIVRDRNRQTINVTPEEGKGEFNTFFEGPDGGMIAPGRFRMPVPATPAVPGTPVPLNRIYIPGRIL